MRRRERDIADDRRREPGVDGLGFSGREKGDDEPAGPADGVDGLGFAGRTDDEVDEDETEAEARR